MNLTDYGFNPTYCTNIPTHLLPARITAVHKNRFELVCSHGHGFGQLKSSAYFYEQNLFPTVGDFVFISYQAIGDSIIEQTLPRKTYFSRLDPSSSGHKEQAVAANFDYAFILQSLNQDFNPRRLERYLTLSWQSGAIPVVILTKADLQNDNQPFINQAHSLAGSAEVLTISVKSKQGTQSLAPYITPKKTIVLLGSSGVGKSSLTNFLLSEERMAVKDIRQDDSRGRHTTTHRQLVMLPSNAMIIDTPGMREIGMWDISQGADESFKDIITLAQNCKFHDCQHKSEPGCAIQKALTSGILAPQRWKSYLRLKKEARYTATKENYLQTKSNRNKEISKYAKALKKNKERF